MKNKIILALFFAASLVSCKKDDSGSNNGTVAFSVAQVNSTVAAGSWRVSYFFDNGDETANFNGYSFVFGSNGSVTATKGSTVVTGTWSSGTDDSKIKLFLNFSGPANFVDLSDDWHITSRTDTRIVMEDVSGGGSGTDFLTLERN